MIGLVFGALTVWWTLYAIEDHVDARAGGRARHRRRARGAVRRPVRVVPEARPRREGLGPAAGRPRRRARPHRRDAVRLPGGLDRARPDEPRVYARAAPSRSRASSTRSQKPAASTRVSTNAFGSRPSLPCTSTTVMPSRVAALRLDRDVPQVAAEQARLDQPRDRGRVVDRGVGHAEDVAVGRLEEPQQAEHRGRERRAERRDPLPAPRASRRSGASGRAGRSSAGCRSRPRRPPPRGRRRR